MVRYYSGTTNIEKELNALNEEFFKNIGSYKTRKSTLISGSR